MPWKACSGILMTRKPDDERQRDQLEHIFGEADQLPGGADEQPVAPDIPPDRTRRFQHVNFSRMRTTWLESDAVKVAEMGRIADLTMARCFGAAYAFMETVYFIVREPEINALTEEPLRGQDFQVRWKRDERGLPVEHWSRLGDRQRSEMLDQLMVGLVEWEQQAAAMWGSAMFAKGIWEESFAYGYTTPRDRKLTIDDRTQMGHLASIEERYFAIYESILSRRADALIRGLNRIYMRLMKAES
jgi:hypothetical protein